MITLNVNGKSVSVDVPDNTRLLWTIAWEGSAASTAKSGFIT